jgi:hypothetical protein
MSGQANTVRASPDGGGNTVGIQSLSSTSTTSDASYQTTATSSQITSSSVPESLATSTQPTALSMSSTASSTGTNPTSTNSNAHSSQISPSTLAGGIVGAAIGAALLAFLLTSFFCLRRMKNQQRSSRRRSRFDKYGYGGPDEKPTAEVEKYSWGKYLPQPADDSTIRASVKSLFDEVQLHVENYYARANVDLTTDIAKDLKLVPTALSDKSTVQLLADAQSPIPVIKHCLAYMMASSIDMSAAPEQSLLPAGWTISSTSGIQDGTSKMRAAGE